MSDREDFEFFCKKTRNILYCTYGTRFVGTEINKQVAMAAFAYFWEEYKKDLQICERLGINYKDYIIAKNPDFYQYDKGKSNGSE